MMGWCPYDNKECRHDGYCKDCERTMINAKPSKHGTEERVMKKEEIDRIECAIRHIQTAVDVDPWAVEIAVSAMEKQIPKDLIAEGDGYADGSMVYDSFYCPSCDHHMEWDEVEDYCPNCGQKICWGDNR